MLRMLDLFCGRWGWSKAFAARGWECVGVDLVIPADVPEGCRFTQADILTIECINTLGWFDFICASPPCDEFSRFQMPWTRAKGPAYPEMGIKLFNHARQLCEASGLPYLIENVRAAQQYVGYAARKCGPFYLWGNGIPDLLPYAMWKKKESYGSKEKANRAEIPPGLANCVADYAERLLEQKGMYEVIR